MINSTSIVGMHFRPPAKAIIAACPNGTPLILEPEPTNAYDPTAVKVLIDLNQFDEDSAFWQELEPQLATAGVEKDELLGGPRHIAYVDKAKTGNAAKVFVALATHGYSASLAFDSKGLPLANIEWFEIDDEE